MYYVAEIIEHAMILQRVVAHPRSVVRLEIACTPEGHSPIWQAKVPTGFRLLLVALWLRTSMSQLLLSSCDHGRASSDERGIGLSGMLECTMGSRLLAQWRVDSAGDCRGACSGCECVRLRKLRKLSVASVDEEPYPVLPLPVRNQPKDLVAPVAFTENGLPRLQRADAALIDLANRLRAARQDLEEARAREEASRERERLREQAS
eukprot:3065036-Amphidinium_carterae.1